MKHTLLLLIIFATIASNAIAQEIMTDYRDELIFGLKAGSNLSDVYEVQGGQFKTKSVLGYVGGIYGVLPIWKKIGFQPEILYSQKGFNAIGTSLSSVYNFTRITSFIDVPLFFTVKPCRFLMLLAGPQVSYLVNQKDEFTGISKTIAQESEFKNNNTRKNILCFITGFDVSYEYIVIGGRLGWDLQNNNGSGTSLSPQYKNMWSQATLGFRF